MAILIINGIVVVGSLVNLALAVRDGEETAACGWLCSALGWGETIIYILAQHH